MQELWCAKMRKIAIVFGFSEHCFELARQLIVSALKTAQLSNLDASYHIFAYECNYNLASKHADPFQKTRTFKDMPGEIHQRSSVGLKWGSVLPDIVIYDDFVNTTLDDYDYTLFCHDDIYLKRYPVFKDLVAIIDQPNTNLIAEPSVACLRDMSIRFRPAFVFVRTDKFRQAQLSFINDYKIMNEDVKYFPIEMDGGAGLLASYYHTSNPVDAIPFTQFPATWFKHLRFDSDYGVEMYNLMTPNSPQFHRLLQRAKRYADYQIYGRHAD
jgi:hypothetical protein